MRIPIWSTKCITARWFGPAGPLVDADLQPVGTDRLAGTVTNRQSCPARGRDPGLRQAGLPARHAGPRGDGPGRARRATATSPGYLKDEGRQLPVRPAVEPRTTKIDRADLLLALMFHDSESTRDQRAVARQRDRSTTST